MPTSRVHIRPITADDCGALVHAVNRSRSLHGSWVAPPTTPEAFVAYVDRISQPTHVGLAIIEQQTGEIVGVVNINEIVRGLFQSAYLGYYALEPWSGKGLMREGMKMAIRYVFTVLKLHRLEANIQPENAASIAFVKGLGFRKEGYSPRYLKIAGRWRDHERWAITKEEFKA